MRNHSIQLFTQFIKRDTITGAVTDATGVNSRECYLAWLVAQNRVETDQEAKRFQRVLSNHVCGVDGRQSFSADEEQAILRHLRQKTRWSCFPAHVNVGHTGFRSRGYHEKLASARPPSPEPLQPVPVMMMEEEEEEEVKSTSYRDSSEEDDAASNGSNSPGDAAAALAAMDGLALFSSGYGQQQQQASASPSTTTGNDAALLHLTQSIASLVHGSSINPSSSSSSTATPFDHRAWRRVAAFLRLAMLATTPLCSIEARPVEYAQALCAQATQARPTCSVAVIDVTIKSYRRAFVCQNATSLAWFGNVGRDSRRELVHEDDVARTASVMAMAFYCPGFEYTASNVRCFNVRGEPMVVNFGFCVDPASFLVVCTAAWVG